MNIRTIAVFKVPHVADFCYQPLIFMLFLGFFYYYYYPGVITIIKQFDNMYIAQVPVPEE